MFTLRAVYRIVDHVDHGSGQPGNAASGDDPSNVVPLKPDWLLEEYKIIQAKIDKLGEDMFKVRSWCITLFTGVAAGAKFSGGLSASLLLMLLPIVFAFQLVEYRQRQIARRSMKRLRNIEVKVRQNLRKTGRSLTLAPYMGTRLLADGVKDNVERTIRSWARRRCQKLLQSPRVRKEADLGQASEAGIPERGNPTFLDCVVAHADFWFYVAQYAIIVGLLCAACSPNKKPNPILTLQLGTNSLSLTSASTNLIVTNYIVHTKETTNFIEARVVTTNFIVTNLVTTNYIR